MEGLGRSAFDDGFIWKGEGRVLGLCDGKGREGLGVLALCEAATVR